uniref:Uncharacterized protein n=1 Tax=Anopheles epiroticus TaxID=199890 RepID=A0A182PEZ9_9DIPT
MERSRRVPSGSQQTIFFSKNRVGESLGVMYPTKNRLSRDCYPRVLEHIIKTQSPQVLCRDYKEILGTLDIISTDPGKGNTV